MVTQPDAVGVGCFPTRHLGDLSETMRQTDVVNQMAIVEDTGGDNVEACHARQFVPVEDLAELSPHGVCAVPAAAITVLVEVTGDHDRHISMAVSDGVEIAVDTVDHLGGGSAFHADKGCQMLVGGQESAIRRGGSAASIEVVNVQQALGSGRFPCQGCLAT